MELKLEMLDISYGNGLALLHDVPSDALSKEFNMELPDSDNRGRCGLCGFIADLIPSNLPESFTEHHFLRSRYVCPRCYVVLHAKPFFRGHDILIIYGKVKSDKLDEIAEAGIGTCKVCKELKRKSHIIRHGDTVIYLLNGKGSKKETRQERERLASESGTMIKYSYTQCTGCQKHIMLKSKIRCMNRKTPIIELK